MPGPENYNDSGIVLRVDPTVVWHEAAVELPKIAQIIHDSIENIFHTWEGLRLSWNGKSAVEAKDFNDRFNANLRSLFGTSDAPSSGVLPKVATAAGMAAVNFGGTEDAVMRMFDTLSSGLGTSTPPPPWGGARNPALGGQPYPPAGGRPTGGQPPDTPPTRKLSGGQVDEDTP